jgi:hypothetical protein
MAQQEQMFGGCVFSRKKAHHQSGPFFKPASSFELTNLSDIVNSSIFAAKPFTNFSIASLV